MLSDREAFLSHGRISRIGILVDLVDITTCMTNHFISDDPRAAFYPSYQVSKSIQLESSYFPSMFLLLENGTLMAGTPNNGNEIFQMEYKPSIWPSINFFRQGDCFMAFNSDGQSSTSACSITDTDVATYFTII